MKKKKKPSSQFETMKKVRKTMPPKTKILKSKKEKIGATRKSKVFVTEYYNGLLD
jgi:hypothetical protein